MFKASHGSATAEKATEAANRLEYLLGQLLNGDKKALSKMNVEDLVVLIQFARDKAASES